MVKQNGSLDMRCTMRVSLSIAAVGLHISSTTQREQQQEAGDTTTAVYCCGILTTSATHTKFGGSLIASVMCLHLRVYCQHISTFGSFGRCDAINRVAHSASFS